MNLTFLDIGITLLMKSVVYVLIQRSWCTEHFLINLTFFLGVYYVIKLFKRFFGYHCL